jgi:microcompartment protein CcmK/EutM
MELGLVIGNIVSTIKQKNYHGRKLLLVDALDADLNPTGTTTICVDTVDAGEGDVVLVAREGRAAADILGEETIPVRSLVIGVIDQKGISILKPKHNQG